MIAACPAVNKRSSICGRPVREEGFCGLHSPRQRQNRSERAKRFWADDERRAAVRVGRAHATLYVRFPLSEFRRIERLAYWNRTNVTAVLRTGARKLLRSQKLVKARIKDGVLRTEWLAL